MSDTLHPTPAEADDPTRTTVHETTDTVAHGTSGGETVRASATRDVADRPKVTYVTDPKAKKRLDPARRASRGSAIAGAISLPLVIAGLLSLGVPLAIWQLATIVKTIAVVIANAVSGSGAAADTNETLANIDPNSVSGVTVTFAIIGAVLLVAGVLISILVLRSHGVARPGVVTAVALPMGALVAAIVTASVGALAGLLFSTSDSVGELLGAAGVGLAFAAIISIVATVVVGVLVWMWAGRLFRERAAKDAEVARA